MPMEGRTARRWVRAVLWAERTAWSLPRSDRGLGRHAGRDVLAAYPGVDPDTRPRDTQRHRRERYGPDPIPIVLANVYGIDPRRPNVVFVGRITHRRAYRCLLRAARTRRRRPSSCCWPAQPDTPEIAAEVDDLVSRLAQLRDRGDSGRRDAAHRTRSSSCSATRQCSSVHRSTNRLGIVNLERWPARPPWSPPRWRHPGGGRRW